MATPSNEQRPDSDPDRDGAGRLRFDHTGRVPADWDPNFYANELERYEALKQPNQFGFSGPPTSIPKMNSKVVYSVLCLVVVIILLYGAGHYFRTAPFWCAVLVVAACVALGSALKLFAQRNNKP